MFSYQFKVLLFLFIHGAKDPWLQKQKVKKKKPQKNKTIKKKTQKNLKLQNINKITIKTTINKQINKYINKQKYV